VRAIGQFFEDLFAGDPVALTMVGIIVAVAVLFGLFWLKVRRDLRKEEESRKRKRPGKK
jgi:uncharacterized membrane protein YciS (DUF1049 family)